VEHDTRRWQGPWPSLYAGLVAGLLGQILVFRLNPELAPDMRTVVVGGALWTTWGLMVVGLPLALARAVAARIAQRGRAAPALWPVVSVFVLAAALSWVNADLHPEFLSDGGRRQLYQDAVWWIGAVILILGLRRWPSRIATALLLVLVPMVPLVRILGAPTILGRPLEVQVGPLGRPAHPLVVIGVESLDSAVLLGLSGDRVNPAFEDLMSRGAWGPLDPFRPNLEGAHWTTLATGTLPRRHGVKRQQGWAYPAIVDGTFRTLPWTPQGSRLFLPWDQGRPVDPPASTIPPLWQRIRESGGPSVALNWPGQWPAGQVTLEPPAGAGLAAGEARLLDAALVDFGDEAPLIRREAEQDARFVAEAIRRLEAGTTDVWLRLRILKTGRRLLEPEGLSDTRRRRALAEIVHLVDRQVGAVLAAAPEDALVAVVSTTGMARPDGWEAILRFLGLGQDWRASASECPDGILLLRGPGVAAGDTFAGARLEDLTPTLCYLLQLPVSQYMEGRVILDAVDPTTLSRHPLRVVD
jgi:hypothetical protein